MASGLVGLVEAALKAYTWTTTDLLAGNAGGSWAAQLALFLVPTALLLVVCLVRAFTVYRTDEPLRPAALIVGGAVMLIHGFFFVAMFVYGKQRPVFIGVSIAMTLCDFAFHALPYATDLRLRMRTVLVEGKGLEQLFAVQVGREEHIEGRPLLPSE